MFILVLTDWGYSMEQKITLDNVICRNEFLKNNDNLISEFNELRKIEQICAEFNYEVLQKQFELLYEEADFKHITGNFLILSDRLVSMASRLSSFIEEKTSGHVLGTIFSKDELEKEMMKIDNLIIVGYLENESNFDVIDRIRAKNHRTNVIFYATISSITKRQMNMYGVNCIFERHKPLDEFLKLF